MFFVKMQGGKVKSEKIYVSTVRKYLYYFPPLVTTDYILQLI